MNAKRKKTIGLFGIVCALSFVFGLFSAFYAPQKAAAATRTQTTITTESGASFINFGAGASLQAGEKIVMEAEVKSAKWTGSTGQNNFGFAVSNAAAKSNFYSVGSEASYLFGNGGVTRARIWTKAQGVWTNFDSDGTLTFGGEKSMDFTVLYTQGNWVKVEYQAASSETATDGSWKVLYKASAESDYAVYCSVDGLSKTSAPYGDSIYFGFDVAFGFTLDLYDLTIATSITDTKLNLLAMGGTVSSKEVSVSTEEDTQGAVEVGDVFYRDTYTFVGVGGAYESVQLYAETSVAAGGTLTLETTVRKVDFSTMSEPQFGFNVSDAPSMERMHLAGTKGSYFYGNKNDTIAKFYSTQYGEQSNDSANLTITGAMDYTKYFVAGNKIQVVYTAATATGNDGGYAVYVVGENDKTLVASVSGLSVTDAPYGKVYFGISSYRTLNFQVDALRLLNNAGDEFALNGGEMIELKRAVVVGDQPTIVKTDIEIAKDGAGASLVANEKPINLKAGGTIVLEGAIMSANRDGVPNGGVFGFSISNNRSSSWNYASGTKGSFFYAPVGKAMTVYVDKTHGSHTSLVSGRPSAEAVGLTIGGQVEPSVWFVEGYKFKVFYQAASSDTAKNGKWELYVQKPYEETYALVGYAHGIDAVSAPYGNVYFGWETQGNITVSIANLNFLANEKQVELKGFKGLSSVITSYVLNGADKVEKENYELELFNGGFEYVVEESLLNFEKDGSYTESSFTQTKDFVAVGENALKFTKVAGETAGFKSGFVYLDAGEHVLSFYYKGTGASKVQLRFYDETDAIGTKDLTFSASNFNAAVELPFVAPVNTVKMEVVVYADEAAAFTEYFDELKIYKNDFEYLLYKAAGFAESNDEERFAQILADGKLNLYGVDEEKTADYLDAVKEHLTGAKLYADDLQEIVASVNRKGMEISFGEVQVKNAGFDGVDAIGNPLHWRIVGVISDDCGVSLTDGQDKALVFACGTQTLSLESRHFVLTANYGLTVSAKGTGTLTATLRYYDANFVVVGNATETFTLTADYAAYRVAGNRTDAAYTTVVLTATQSVTVAYMKVGTGTESGDVFGAVNKLDGKDLLAENQSVSAVRSNLTLPTLVDGVSVSWTSSNSSVLSASGAVTRPAYGATPEIVTLTATFTLGTFSYTKNYNFIVEPKQYDEYKAFAVYNADVEENDTENYFGFGGYITQNANATFGVSNAITFDGANSLMIARATATSDLRSYTTFGVSENKTYLAETALFTPFAGVKAGITLEFYGYDGLLIKSYSASMDETAIGEWQNVSVQGASPVGAVSAAIKLYRSDVQKTAVYFDALRLYEMPYLQNATFDYAGEEWTSSGNVTFTGGVATLANGAFVSSKMLSAIPYADYFVETKVEKGSANVKLAFYNASKALIGETAYDVTNAKAFTAFANANVAYAQLIITATGETSVSQVELTYSGYGTSLLDGDFAKDEETWAWSSETNATRAVSVGTLTQSTGGVLISNPIGLLEGKTYRVSANVKSATANGAQVVIVKYTYSNALMEEVTLSGTGAANFELLEKEFVCDYNCKYIRVKLVSNGAESQFKDVAFGVIATSVSNYSFESLNSMTSGSLPFHWTKYGNVHAEAVSAETYEGFDRVLALKLQNVLGGNAGVESAFVKITGGTSYEVTALTYLAMGSAKLKVNYYGADFALLGSFENAIAQGYSNGYNQAAVKGLAPANAAYATVSLETTAKDTVLVADNVFMYESVRQIGNTTQLFIDDYILADVQNGERVVHQARLEEVVIDADPDDKTHDAGGYIYGTTLFDEDEKIYKMWYIASSEKYGLIRAYATSEDGIHWSKPNLGIVLVGGDKNNNLLSFCPFPSIWKDYDETDPAKRYKAIVFSEPDFAYMVIYSADGLTWTKGKIFQKSGDVLTAAYDATNDKFFINCKFDKGKRVFYHIEGDAAMEEFTVPIAQHSLADPIDGLGFQRVDCYGAGLYELYGTYIAFDWVLQIPGTTIMHGPDVIKFAFSRDLTEAWQRPTHDLIVDIEDEMCQYSAAYPIVVGDEVWLYVSQIEGYHESPSQDCYIQIAKWRKDGFVSMSFEESGSLTTKQFTLDGDKLIINADAANGAIQAELLDENGNVISGFSRADSSILSVDSLTGEITFAGDLSALQGRTVSLKLYAENCDVYSFTFSK